MNITKSQMKHFYIDITEEDISTKVFNERLKKICGFLKDNKVELYLNNKEKNFFEKVIKPCIEWEKSFPLEASIFFLPLVIYYDDDMIKNLIKNKNITEQSQIDFIERCGDLFYFNNKFILDYIKYKLNEIINKRKKSKKINYEQIKIIDKVKLQITKEQISSLDESYNISIEIYKEIADIERKRVQNNLSFIFYNVIRFLPVTSKRLILEDLEKIIKNEFKRLSKNKNSNENNIEEYLDYLQSKNSEKEFNNYMK